MNDKHRIATLGNSVVPVVAYRIGLAVARLLIPVELWRRI